MIMLVNIKTNLKGGVNLAVAKNMVVLYMFLLRRYVITIKAM